MSETPVTGQPFEVATADGTKVAVRPRISNPARSRHSSITASAQPSSEVRREGRSLVQTWQAEALDYYDKLPACRYAAQAHAAMVSRVRLFLGIRDESGEVEEIEDSKGVLSRLEDPGGGHASLISKYATLRFLCGDKYLLETPDEDDPDGEIVEIVSPLELRVKPGSGPDTGRPTEYQRIRAPGLTAEELLEAPDEDLDLLDMGEARVWRLYRQHPTYSDWADSPVHPLLHLYEELELLHLEAKAELRSRIARAGILFVDGRLSFTIAGSGEEEAEPEGAADEDPEEDELMEALIEAAVAAIRDVDSPASISPVIARVENTTQLPLRDLIYHWVHEHKTQLADTTERIEKVMGWIAQGTDLPPEILLGFEGSNHWSAWLADDLAWEAHGEGDAIAFCQDITEAYARRWAQRLGMSNWAEVIVWYDPSQVTTDPDRSKNATDLYRDGAISEEAYRSAKGFSRDEDAPSDEERARYAAFRLRDRSLLPGGEDADTGTARDVERGEPDEGEPEPDVEAPPAVQASANGHLDEALVGAAEFALLRSRELAGSRLRSYVLGDSRSKDPDCEDCARDADGVANSDLAAVLGAERLVLIDAPAAAALVSGSASCFVDVATRLGVDARRAADIAAEIEHHAAETLFDANPAPVPLP